jgi:4-hydroxybenzoate polyprenyltransferase
MNSATGTTTASGSDFLSRLGRLGAVVENIRTHDWWEYKIPPLLATAYATALLLHVSFQQLWPLLLLVLFALLPGAAYVCVLNDITDMEDDRLCGKANRMTGRSAWFRFFALAACLLPGLVACWLLRNYPLTLSLYAADWLAFTLYSTPPFRLKVRGIWGVAMDASGAHLLPTLWTASLMAEATGHEVPRFFLCSLGVWAFALGVRGILWHQLFDRENDRRGRVTTFAARKNPQSIRRFVAWISFPLEVAALGFILIQVNTPWAWVMLTIYLVVECLIHRCLGIDLILVQSTSRFRIMFGEYYQLQYPLTFLLAMTQQSWEAGWLIALQLLLFPHCFRVFLGNLHYLLIHRLGSALGRRLKRVLLLIRGSMS